MRRLTAKDIRNRKKIGDKPIPNFYQLNRENPLPEPTGVSTVISRNSSTNRQEPNNAFTNIEVHHTNICTSPELASNTQQQEIVRSNICGAVPGLGLGADNLISIMNTPKNNSTAVDTVSPSDIFSTIRMLQSARENAANAQALLVEKLLEDLRYKRTNTTNLAPDLVSLLGGFGNGSSYNTLLNGLFDNKIAAAPVANVESQNTNQLRNNVLSSSNNSISIGNHQHQQLNSSLMQSHGFDHQNISPVTDSINQTSLGPLISMLASNKCYSTGVATSKQMCAVGSSRPAALNKHEATGNASNYLQNILASSNAAHTISNNMISPSPLLLQNQQGRKMNSKALADLVDLVEKFSAPNNV